MDIGHGRIKWVISYFMFVQLFRWYYLVCFPAPTPPIEKINSSSNNNNVRFNAIIPASWGWQFFALIWVRHLSRSSAYSCFNPNSAKSIFTYSFLDFVGRPFSLFQPISSSMTTYLRISLSMYDMIIPLMFYPWFPWWTFPSSLQYQVAWLHDFANRFLDQWHHHTIANGHVLKYIRSWQ